MEEEGKRETRQRSRSKTPLTLRSSVDREIGTENDKKKSPIKKNPTVETIAEESPVPIATQRTTRNKKTITKIITSDYSSDDGSTDSARLNKETAALIASSVAVVPSAISNEQIVSKVTKTTTVITSKSLKSLASDQIQNVPERGTNSESITKTTTTTRSAATRESNQNDSNVLFEHNLKLKSSTPRTNNVGSHSFTEGVNTAATLNGNNLDEHVPFKEYKDAGEYWNKYPKTDYTYSKFSPHRREILPGVIAMPNMSRRSLEHHHERVTLMAQRNPAQESFLRSRFQSFLTTKKHQGKAIDNYYDSQDETDLSQFGRNGKNYLHASSTKSFIRRFLTVITTFFSSIYYRVTNIFRRSKQSDLYYTRIGEERGFFGKIWHSISSIISSIFRYIYLGISSILFLDSWLLQSSNASNSRKKGFLLLLLVLLPLLLLSGTYYYFDKPAPIPNINISLDQIIDPKLIDNFKTITFNNYNNVVNVSSDYLNYLKSIVQNSATEAKKLWTENFYS